MKTALITVALAVASRSAVSLPACTSSSASSTGQTDTIVQQDNKYCTIMNKWTAATSFYNCCPNESDVQRRALIGLSSKQSTLVGASSMIETSASIDPDACRSISTDVAYCSIMDDPDCGRLIGEKDTLEMQIQMEAPEELSPCCSVCACYGDPLCTAFDGSSDEWIICDGRKSDTCKITRRSCEEQRFKPGPNGGCIYLRGKPGSGYVNWPTSGSPCQPDWALLGTPTMSLYEFDNFKLELELGERGVMNTFIMTSGSKTYRLEAARCFQHDPADPSKNPRDAWTTSIPSDWTVSSVSGDIWWRVFDATVGVYADIVCVHSEGSGLFRLDIQNVLETDPSRIHAQGTAGFCALGKIVEKSVPTNPAHEACAGLDLPDLLTTCKKLVSMDCTSDPATMKTFQEKWCDNANLDTYTVDACKSMITTGTEADRVNNWVDLVCHATKFESKECKIEISQFGWDAFVRSHTDGMKVDGTTCESDPANYGPSSDFCEEGISVQYNKGTGWEEAFFIPNSRPPCTGSLKITGAMHPELFFYPIRFSQCNTKRECLLKNSCRASVGFDVKVNFQTEVCTPKPTPLPTPSPTLPPSTEPKPCPAKLFPGGKLTVVALEPLYSIKMQLNIATLLTKDSSLFTLGECSDTSGPFHVQANVLGGTSKVKFTALASDGTPFECTSPELTVDSNGLKTSILEFIVVEDGKISVLLDSTEICSGTFSNNSPKTGKDLCLYESGLSLESAYVCQFGLILDSVDIKTECECTSSGQLPTMCTQIPDGSSFQGSCKSCCRDPKRQEDGMCREISSLVPYCDSSSTYGNGKKCSDLPAQSGMLNIGLTLSTDGKPCCLSCTCYGDPECEAFDGTYDKWVLCDGRNPKTCLVNEEKYCTGVDHGGNDCLWHPDLAKKNPSLIGVYGSACQPDWDASGQAWMTMYSFAGFDASISMGERGIVETLQITNSGGTYTFVASQCFTDNPWTVKPGSDPVDTALVYTPETPTAKLRNVAIDDVSLGIYIRVLCIMDSDSTGKRAYRLHIQSLLESDEARAESADAGGFCPMKDAKIDVGKATPTDPVVSENCLVKHLDVERLLCISIAIPTCIQTQIDDGINSWCESASLYPSDANRVARCKKEIFGAGSKKGKKWAELYCRAVYPVAAKKDPILTESNWVKQCLSKVLTDGPRTVVDSYGNGKFDTSSSVCGSSYSVYRARTAEEMNSDCSIGVSIEYESAPGTWTEMLFIPANLPPCSGKLSLPASKRFLPLFTSPIRIRQCEPDRYKCTADIACMRNAKFDVTLEYTQNDKVMCPTS